MKENKVKLTQQQLETVAKLRNVLHSIRTFEIAKEYDLSYKQTMALSGLKASIDKFLRSMRYQDEYDIMVQIVSQLKGIWEGTAGLNDGKPVSIKLQDGKPLMVKQSDLQAAVAKFKEAEPIRKMIENLFAILQ